MLVWRVPRVPRPKGPAAPGPGVEGRAGCLCDESPVFPRVKVRDRAFPARELSYRLTPPPPNEQGYPGPRLLRRLGLRLRPLMDKENTTADTGEGAALTLGLGVFSPDWGTLTWQTEKPCV